MRVFISWSGERSKQVARVFKAWLPKVMQGVEPWMSDEDIERGSIFFDDIATALADTSIGIICLTRDNLRAPWVLFEAGALAKGLTKNRVCPLLIDLDLKDLSLPLSVFNATRLVQEDIFKLLKTINVYAGAQKLADHILEDVFRHKWKVLEKQLSKVLKSGPPHTALPFSQHIDEAKPHVFFDCTAADFENHLAQCESATIIGVTNENLLAHLEHAWSQRKASGKGPWQRLWIVFLTSRVFPHAHEAQRHSLSADVAEHSVVGELWRLAVPRIRDFLEGTGHQNAKARELDIRSSSTMLPFVGQIYDNKHIRIAYALPSRDLRKSCYLNFSTEQSPCAGSASRVLYGFQNRANLTSGDSHKNTPPCKMHGISGENLNALCQACHWKEDRCPSVVIRKAVDQVTSASVPLFAANVVGSRGKGDGFSFFCLCPQRGWRDFSIPGQMPTKPAHLLSFVLLRQEEYYFLQRRSARNSSGELSLYGVIPGKVNDEDFFEGQVDADHRQAVYQMLMAWDDAQSASTRLVADGWHRITSLATQFASRIGIQVGKPIVGNVLDSACKRAAARTLSEKLDFVILAERLIGFEQTFWIERPKHVLCIRLYTVDVQLAEVPALVKFPGADLHRLTEDQIRGLGKKNKLTEFLSQNMDYVLGESSTEPEGRCL